MTSTFHTRGRALCLTIGIMSSALVAQVANENKANQMVDARRQNSALMRQYNWNSRTELVRDGKVEDVRIDAVTFGPEGQVQRTVLNDQETQRMPRRFLRHAIAEKKQKDQEEYLGGLIQLLDQYTLPTAGKVIDFMSQAQAQPFTAPDGTQLTKVTGNNVVVPGDTFTLTLNPATMQPRRAEVSTTYKGDPATLTATFNTLKSGLNYLQFGEVDVPAKNLSLQVHNFDYVRNE